MEGVEGAAGIRAGGGGGSRHQSRRGRGQQASEQGGEGAEGWGKPGPEIQNISSQGVLVGPTYPGMREDTQCMSESSGRML